MKLIERDGKLLLSQHGMQIPQAVFLPKEDTAWPTDATWIGPCYIKAQTLSGRRGTSGLIQKCETLEDLPPTIQKLVNLLGDTPYAGFLCEEEVPHTEEWLIAVDIDREQQMVCVALSAAGGMDVSSVAHIPFEMFLKQNAGAVPEAVRSCVITLEESLRKTEATSIEINPFVKTLDGAWVALDAKMELDDLAVERHPEYASLTHLSPLGRPLSEREAAYDLFLKEAGHRGTLGKYVELDGDIALILSGGGASLVALDALHRTGKKAANYVELSGNPDPASVERAASIVLSKPGITALWIAGSFANFTDIFETMRATLQAVNAAGLRIPIVIRRDGPRTEEAIAFVEAWSKTYAAPVLFHRGDVSLDASAQALVKLRPCPSPV